MNDFRGDLVKGLGSFLKDRRFRLVRLGEKMNALSPLLTLRRGYAVPLDPDGRVLRTIGDFSPGDLFELRVLDGRVRAETRGIRTDEVDREP